MEIVDVIGLVSDIVGLGTFLFTALAFWRARNQLRRYLQSQQDLRLDHPAAVVVDLTGTDITQQVKAYLKEQGQDMHLANCRHEGVTSDNFWKIISELQRIKSDLTELDIREVHLFYKGPVTVGMAIGMLFDNWVPVHVYQFSRGRYERHAVLTKESIKGIKVSPIDVGKDALSGAEAVE